MSVDGALVRIWRRTGRSLAWRGGILATALVVGLASAVPAAEVPALQAESGAADAGSAVAMTQPNLIFVMFDDVGYGDLGVYGNTTIQTPNLDAFAAEGMLFTHYYANAPICSPTRTSILSGQYPQRHGIRRVFGGSSLRGIPLGVTTLPEVLKGYGYSTGHVGKWHIGREPDFVPINNGFDSDVRMVSKLNPGLSDSYFDPTITIDDVQTVQFPGRHLTSVLTDYAIEFVTENQAGPFYLNLWYGAPHKPLEPPQEWADQYPPTEEGLYSALLSNADEQVGRLLQAIDDLGLADNTLVVITSDNGGEPAYHDHPPTEGPSNGGLAGAKRNVWDGGIRVPMMARWGDVTTPGAVDDSVLSSFDIFPTFVEAAGGDLVGLDIDAESFLSVLEGNGPKARAGSLFWEVKENARYFDSPSGILNKFAVRRDDWKLVFESGEAHLYDLATDPSESNDLSGVDPVLVDELLAEHQDWRLSNGLIAHQVHSTEGDVTLVDDVWTFTDGAVQLHSNTLYNIDDLDFSFAATITPSTLDGSAQYIAQLGRSWRLLITPGRRLVVEMTSGNGSTRSRIVSSQVLQAGVEYDVAFTLFGWKSDNETFRLYVDGVLQGETNDLSKVKPVYARPQIGNDSSRSFPFRGEIRDLQLYSLSLTPAEVVLVQAD